MFVFGCFFSEDEILSKYGPDDRAKHLLDKGYDISLWGVIDEFKVRYPEFCIDTISTAGKQIVAFGREYHTMGQDETRSQFEGSVVSTLKELFDFDFRCFMMEVAE